MECFWDGMTLDVFLSPLTLWLSNYVLTAFGIGIAPSFSFFLDFSEKWQLLNYFRIGLRVWNGEQCFYNIVWILLFIIRITSALGNSGKMKGGLLTYWDSIRTANCSSEMVKSFITVSSSYLILANERLFCVLFVMALITIGFY